MYKAKIETCGTNWHIADSTTQKHIATHIREDTNITHQKVTDHQFIKRKRVVLSNNKMQIYGLRGLQIKDPSQLVPRSQAATWEPQTSSRRQRRTHLAARCRPPLKNKYKGSKERLSTMYSQV